MHEWSLCTVPLPAELLEEGPPDLSVSLVWDALVVQKQRSSSNALSSVQANALAGVPPRLLVPLLQSCQFPIRIWLTLQAFTFYIYIRGGNAAVVPRRRCRQATR